MPDNVFAKIRNILSPPQKHQDSGERKSGPNIYSKQEEDLLCSKLEEALEEAELKSMRDFYSRQEEEHRKVRPVLKQYDEMKAKHPDAMLAFRVEDNYVMFKEDALEALGTFGGCLSRINDRKKLGAPYYSFSSYDLDKKLLKLERSGKRVVCCEPLKKAHQKQCEENNSQISKIQYMPRKKKSQAASALAEKTADKKKTDVKSGAETIQSQDIVSERKSREPQMITVNGQKVTHGHAYQGNENPQNWYFTAKLDGVQLKPQLMSQEDLAAYTRKELTVPQLMEKYYPTKLMEKVPDTAFKIPNVIAGPDGPITVDKFNVYKEKDPARDDFGKYKFYAQVGDKKMSALASKEDLNAYFDHVMAPGQLVEKNFGERLHLTSAYEKYKLPEGVNPDNVRIGKSKDGSWTVSVDLGERGKTSRVPLSYDDGFSYFQAKTASREQLAAKYLGNEINSKMSESLTVNVSKSRKM